MPITITRTIAGVLLCAMAALLFGCPPKPQKVNVPDLAGMTQNAAESALVAAGLVLGDVSEEESETVPEGQVIRQDPAAGGRVESGTAVDIVVSLGPKPDEFTYDVEYAPGTVLVDEDHLDLVVSADEENHVYTFDAAGVEDSGLDLVEGSPLIIHGTAVRRITSVTPDGDNLVVETEFIPLNEVIPNGTLAWDYGVAFTAKKVRAVEVPGFGVVYPKDGEPIEFSFEIGEYNYEIKATLEDAFASLEFTITKGLGGPVEARFEAKGQIQRFRSKDRITFAGGEPQEYDHQLNGMQGELTLELIVAASVDDSDAVNIELPATLLTVPFLLGPIPVELKVKVQFVINAALPAAGSAHVKTAFTYDSDLGFTYEGTTATAGGRLGDVTFGKDTNETGAPSFISVNFGMGFPRVELDIAKETLVPWAQTAFLIGGSYTVYPACQTADALFLGALGFDLKILGWNLASGSKTLFEKKEPLLRAGECPEDKMADGLFDTALWLQEDFAPAW